MSFIPDLGGPILTRYWGESRDVFPGGSSALAMDDASVERLTDKDLFFFSTLLVLSPVGRIDPALPVIREALKSKDDEILVLQLLLAIDEGGLLEKEASLRALVKRVRSGYGVRVVGKVLEES